MICEGNMKDGKSIQTSFVITFCAFFQTGYSSRDSTVDGASQPGSRPNSGTYHNNGDTSSSRPNSGYNHVDSRPGGYTRYDMPGPPPARTPPTLHRGEHL